MTLYMREQEKYEEGLKIGTHKILIDLVEENLISISDASKSAGLTEAEFEELLKIYNENR